MAAQPQAEWPKVPLGELCSKIQDGTHFSPNLRGGEFLYVTSRNIRPGRLDVSDAPRIDRAQHDAIYRRCDVKYGDVLLTKDGASTGNAALNDLHEPFSLLSSVAFLRPSPQAADSRYILQQLLSDPVQRQIQEAMSGNAITRLTLAKIKKLAIPTAPLVQQRAIAAGLSDADALIAALERLIAKKRDIKQGAMQELLTGKRRLPGFEGAWEVKRLGSVTSSESGGTPPISQGQYFGGGIPWVSIGDMTGVGKHVFTTERTLSAAGLAVSPAKIWPAETILYAMYASLGECAIAGVELCSSQAILGIRCQRGVDTEYLYYQLIARQGWVRGLAQHGTQPNLNAEIVRGFEIPVPDIVEQQAIAAILTDMDAEIIALEARLTKARDIKQGMMQQLLTGRIRLA